MPTVTKTPRGINYESNSGETDNITLLAMAQRWPKETWNSLLQRALYQAHKLNEASANSDGRLIMIKSRGDLASGGCRSDSESREERCPYWGLRSIT